MNGPLVTVRSLEALRRLVLVTAAVCLLGTGGIDLLRTPAGATPSVSAGVAPRAGAEPVIPAVLSTLRSALAAATPLSGGGDLAAPGVGLSLAPRLVSGRPAVVPALRAPVIEVDGPDGRGPPPVAGT